MKRILLTIIISLAFIVPCYAVNGHGEEEAIQPESSLCPKTKMKDSCKSCHAVPDWTIKEKTPEANLRVPHGPDMEIRDEGKTAYLLITEIESYEVATFFSYVRWHPEIEKCVFEIMSPGGSLFQAWRIVGLMEMWKARGMKIETIVHGMCMSAGFMIYVNGTEKYASDTAELMWHELMTFAMFKISRPSDTEDEAVILRHLQDTACQYLSERSKLTKEEWHEKVYKKEFWCNGAEAVKYGLSDGAPK